MQRKTVAIVGAGPVGLAAAAHALERGLRPVVLEAGEERKAFLDKARHALLALAPQKDGNR